MYQLGIVFVLFNIMSASQNIGVRRCRIILPGEIQVDSKIGNLILKSARRLEDKDNNGGVVYFSIVSGYLT